MPGPAEIDERWPSSWRGRWIWDREPEQAYWWRPTPVKSHAVYLRRSFELGRVPASMPARVTCDSRYVLFLNGILIGRGPVRGEPEFLGWDPYDLAPALSPGTNVLVALCRYYGTIGPWWVPAEPLGMLGRGSFCFETGPDSPLQLISDERWKSVPAPWLANDDRAMHSFPPEIVDGRLSPERLHDPRVDESRWPDAVVIAGRAHGTVLDRPPAAPYMTPLQRPIPQLRSTVLEPQLLERDQPVRVRLHDDPAETWSTVELGHDGDRRLAVWDIGRLSLGHVRLTIRGATPALSGAAVDVVGGEDLRPDGLPETRPRRWAARYLLGGEDEEAVAFFDPVGLRYLAAHHPAGVEVSLAIEETTYPRPNGAAFDCDDPRYTEAWQAAARTVDLCSTDAFLDCPGREQRAWVADAYVQMLVSYVTNPDWRLVRHHLELTARSRFPSGLLAGAAGCDFAHVGMTMPEYSLHWIRSLAGYWRHAGDEEFVRSLLPVADAILERYEAQRGPSGLLEDFPGWVFVDWVQIDRDTVTAVHDALYAAALEDYAGLPGAADVHAQLQRTTAAFEALWDGERGIYVDAIGSAGRSRRVSQHTNAAALLAGLVPEARVAGVIERIVEPRGGLGGRLVETTPAALFDDPTQARSRIPDFQYEVPEDFDPEVDVVAAGPWFSRFLHEALFRHDRRDLILDSLLRWKPLHGTLQEFWRAPAGAASRCHGWSASPAYDLTTYVLGVRPAEPGYRRAVVDPYLGPLRRASGRVPTPLGWLSVAVEDQQVSLDVPEGMTVTVGGGELGAGSDSVTVGTAREPA